MPLFWDSLCVPDFLLKGLIPNNFSGFELPILRRDIPWKMQPAGYTLQSFHPHQSFRHKKINQSLFATPLSGDLFPPALRPPA
jgi:hypothetical protein